MNVSTFAKIFFNVDSSTSHSFCFIKLNFIQYRMSTFQLLLLSKCRASLSCGIIRQMIIILLVAPRVKGSNPPFTILLFLNGVMMKSWVMMKNGVKLKKQNHFLSQFSSQFLSQAKNLDWRVKEASQD